MENYEDMLKKGISKITRNEGGERFETPKVEVLLQGNQTIISNFIDVCGKIRRDCNHLIKFLSKELAVPGSLSGQRVTFQRKLSGQFIQGKVQKYVDLYVICPACKRPDTSIIKEDRIEFIKCESCGAKNSIK